MAHYPTTIILSTIKGLIQGKLICDSQRPRYAPVLPSLQLSHDERTPSAFIHILDNDSLFNIFLLCRPALLDESEEDAVEILGGRKWNDERWWYSLVQVCRRWRYLVLESGSLLGLSLLCTYGTPIVDMLAHSPPLPLILDYSDLYDYITADDELGIKFALEQRRDRVRRIRIMQPVHILQRLIKALRGEFPNLEYIFIERHTFYRPNTENSVIVDFPGTFRAPRLRYLMAMGLPIPIASPLFTTMGNFVTLSLNFDVSWVYFHPNPLLQQVLRIPQLETSESGNTFDYTHFPSDEMESQLLRRSVTRRITPYLRRFGFQCANAYLEALLPRVTIRLLERLQLYFLDQLKSYLILPRRQFMSSVGAFPLKSVRLVFFKDYLRVDAYSHDSEFKTYHFSMSQGGRHLDRQLASVTKFFHTLGAVFSVVESLILRCDRPPLIPSESEWNREADPTQWRELFRAFGHLKALYMDYVLVGQLSRFLQPEPPGDEGESPATTDLLLPELRELWYSTLGDPESDDGGASESFFAEFALARRNAGRPVNVFQAVIPSSRILG